MVSESSSETLHSKRNRRTDKDAHDSTSLSGSSLTRVKNEIQTMMDLMGPSTPVLDNSVHNPDSEADNELSKSSESMAPPVNKSNQRPLQEVVQTKNRRNVVSKWKKSSHSTPPASESVHPNDSVLAEAGNTDISTSNLNSYAEMPTSIPHYCVNPGCMCMMGYKTSVPVVPSKVQTDVHNSSGDCRRKGIMDWLKTRSIEFMMKKPNQQPCELYRINIMGQGDDTNHPRRLVFDLVDGIPRPSTNSVATNTRLIKNPVERMKSPARYASTIEKSRIVNYANYTNTEDCHENNMAADNDNQAPNQQKNVYYDSNGDTRVDFYYFDHGNAQYFHTTDTPPVMACEILAEKTERYTTRFWAEIFSTVHIVVSFCVSFVLQFFKFLLYSILRPLTVGLMQLASDYFFKPFLTTLFNGIIQPILIFLYNIATSLRDLLDPIAEGFGYFFRELAVFCSSMRFCAYYRSSRDGDKDKNTAN